MLLSGFSACLESTKTEILADSYDMVPKDSSSLCCDLCQEDPDCIAWEFMGGLCQRFNSNSNAALGPSEQFTSGCKCKSIGQEAIIM